MSAGELSEKTIQDLLLKYTKEKNRVGLSVVKMVKTKISTEKGRLSNVSELPEAEILKIVKREMKEIQDTIDSYRKAGMADRVPEEEEKLRILESLLPSQLSDEDIRGLVAQVVAETGGRNFGQVMKAVMAKVAGRADGKRVSEIVKQALSPH
jgi:uncharacterized protein YqeY